MDSIHDTPTEADKIEDLERQYVNLERGDGVSVVCPWCFSINKPDTPACCAFFTDGVKKRGERQLASVIKQLREIRLGAKKSMHCPYCDTWIKNAEHPADWPRPYVSPFCCNLLSDAATAIVERQMAQRLADDKKKIEDHVAAGKAGRN